MVDEERILQKQEITGEEVATCDLCGRPVHVSALVKISGVPTIAEPIEELHVCEECWCRIEQEEVPFDAEIAARLQDEER